MVRRSLQLPLLPVEWRSITFEKAVPEQNCYRHYQIVLQEGQTGWTVITYRGRIGRARVPLVEPCDTWEDAIALGMKRARDRLLHGYKVTDFTA